jgi:superfamily I DNA and/or RNA helicase
MRDLSFFDHLGRLVELERSAERARFEELRAELSPSERAARGLALLDLESVEESWGLGGRRLITFERQDRSLLEARLGVGDIVELRPRKAEVEEPARGIVARRAASRVTIAFDRPPPPYVSEGRLLIDLVPNDVTFERMRAALRRVMEMDRGAPRRRRDVLLGTEPARFERAQPVAPSRPLNPEQEEAVARALAARDVFLVHGPPGTGKSTVLAEVAVQAVRRGERVLACAASNAAVDHLLDLCLQSGLGAIRIGHPARVAERFLTHTLDVLVEQHPDRQLARDLFEEGYDLLGYARRQRARGRSGERFANARGAQALARKLFDEARALEKRALRAVLSDAQVLCATCASLPSGELEGESFDLAVCDEATQAMEPVALLAFLAAPRLVLAGDHRQLPPTILSREASGGGLSVSLFERLLADHGDGIRAMLREQYRMNEGIMAFPSAEMYEGELRAHPSVAHRLLADLLPDSALDAPPVLFLDTAGKGYDDAVREGTDSYQNPGEAELVLGRLRALLGAGLAPNEVAVIAPYSAQIALLRERMAELAFPAGVEVDTVDAFQGREKEAVLVSFTRSNSSAEIGFLAELRRMNVAITRAKRHLFVVGDSATLAGHPYYQRFLAHVQAQGGYRSAWEWQDGAP